MSNIQRLPEAVAKHSEVVGCGQKSRKWVIDTVRQWSYPNVGMVMDLTLWTTKANQGFNTLRNTFQASFL